MFHLVKRQRILHRTERFNSNHLGDSIFSYLLLQKFFRDVFAKTLILKTELLKTQKRNGFSPALVRGESKFYLFGRLHFKIPLLIFFLDFIWFWLIAFIFFLESLRCLIG